MSDIDREAIYEALFQAVAGCPGVVTAGRRLRHWSDVTPAEQPALFLVQRRELPSTAPGRPTLWRLHADLYLYAHDGGDPSVLPAAQLNPILDAVAASLGTGPTGIAEPEAGRVLGGLAVACRIDRAGIVTDAGKLGAQAVAIVPIEILALGT